MRILIMEDGGMEYLIMIILLSTLLFEVYKQILFKGIPQKKPGQLMHITATVSQTILVIWSLSSPKTCRKTSNRRISTSGLIHTVINQGSLYGALVPTNTDATKGMLNTSESLPGEKEDPAQKRKGLPLNSKEKAL